MTRFTIDRQIYGQFPGMVNLEIIEVQRYLGIEFAVAASPVCLSKNPCTIGQVI
jgi:hypothetical protein